MAAHSAMRKKDYGGAAQHWEAALALNPLHPDGWFALGYAALKAADDTRAVQVCRGVYCSHTSAALHATMAEAVRS
jgi:predicted TPR repeat methyltransferase